MFFSTGIKAYMPAGVVLLLYPRSSMGINRRVILANGTGVIDPDYVDNPENQGNIGAALWNCGTEPQTIHVGERYMQGVFIRFATCGDRPKKMRRGGIGSTNRE